MVSPITLTSSHSNYTLTGYPVRKNGCKGFLITAYTNLSNNVTCRFVSHGSCHGLLVSDDIEGITGSCGWYLRGRSRLTEPILTLHEELLPYFNKPITRDQIKGWHIEVYDFSKKTVEDWYLDSFDKMDRLLFEQLL